jgi:hypothetical protein
MKSKTLQERLARSLDQANTKEAKKRPGRQRPLAPPPPEKRCTKLSVSLFDTDMQRVKAIRAYILEARGESPSTSQIIKIALRTAPLTAALAAALDEAAAEDGRKW